MIQDKIKLKIRQLLYSDNLFVKTFICGITGSLIACFYLLISGHTNSNIYVNFLLSSLLLPAAVLGVLHGVLGWWGLTYLISQCVRLITFNRIDLSKPDSRGYSRGLAYLIGVLTLPLYGFTVLYTIGAVAKLIFFIPDGKEPFFIYEVCNDISSVSFVQLLSFNVICFILSLILEWSKDKALLSLVIFGIIAIILLIIAIVSFAIAPLPTLFVIVFGGAPFWITWLYVKYIKR